MNADSRMSINDRMNLVFQDSDILPLFVQVRAPAEQAHGSRCADAPCAAQENYVNLRPNAAGSDLQRLVRRVLCEDVSTCAEAPFPACQELLARASSSIADGDVLMSTVRRYQARAHRRTVL